MVGSWSSWNVCVTNWRVRAVERHTEMSILLNHEHRLAVLPQLDLENKLKYYL